MRYVYKEIKDIVYRFIPCVFANKTGKHINAHKCMDMCTEVNSYQYKLQM